MTKTVYRFSMKTCAGNIHSICIFGDDKRSPTRKLMVYFCDRQLKKYKDNNSNKNKECESFWSLVKGTFEHCAEFPMLNEHEDYKTYYSISVERLNVYSFAK